MKLLIKNRNVNQYFSSLMDRSTSAPMKVIADGTQVNENPAAGYRGFGCISANSSSRLLLDYKVEHPQAYEEIMRLLFEKNYGAGITHIKLELGADVNSSSGTEPCSKRSANEPADVTRGAGFQFAADAKAINPDLTIDMLRWGEPGWVTNAFSISQEHGLNARYRWYKETLDAAYAVYGLKFDYISADQNETDTPDEAWILYLRYRLDHETNVFYDYSKIKIIASDEVGTHSIAEQMVDNSVLRNAVDVIGLHYTTYGDSYTNLLNEAYGKEIWYSEGIAPCNVPELTVQADESGLIGQNGPIDVANRIINSYYNGKMVMYEFQPAVAAYYDGACYAPKQLIRAWEPWSGHFVIDIGFWMAMHFSRFAQKGWMYVNGACYGDGEEDHTISNTMHNFMTLTSPDRTELSMFFTNESDETRTYSVMMKDMAFDPVALSTVITKGPGSRQPYDINWFQKGKSIRANHNHVFLIKVPPRSIMTVTTLDTNWVNGVNTFPAVQPPQTKRLPIPYHDDLHYTADEIRVRGCAPRYMTDQGGAFELMEADDGYAICQRITPQNMPTNWRFRGTPQPVTTFGDDKWRCYSMEAEVRLSSLDQHNYAGIGLRYNSAVTCEYTSLCGYSGRIYGDGNWKLMDMESVAAEGLLPHVDPKAWNKLKLIVLGNSIFFFIGGNLMTKYTPQCMINSGRACLCSEYAWNMFRSIHIDPVAVQPLYVRRIDCFGNGILYNENWEIHAMEHYSFYHRTSMEAKQGAKFSCDFEGTGIAVIGTAQNAEFTVLVDGHTVYENFSVASCLPRQACFTIDTLPECKHNLCVFVTNGAFRLDVLEVPEAYAGMPDTLMIPSNLCAAISTKRQQSQTAAASANQFMDAEAMLWHIAHPFTAPPKPEPEPEAEPQAAETPEEARQVEAETTTEQEAPTDAPQAAPDEAEESAPPAPDANATSAAEPAEEAAAETQTDPDPQPQPMDEQEIAEQPEQPEQAPPEPEEVHSTPEELYTAFGEAFPEEPALTSAEEGDTVQQMDMSFDEFLELLHADKVENDADDSTQSEES